MCIAILNATNAVHMYIANLKPTDSCWLPAGLVRKHLSKNTERLVVEPPCWKMWRFRKKSLTVTVGCNGAIQEYLKSVPEDAFQLTCHRNGRWWKISFSCPVKICNTIIWLHGKNWFLIVCIMFQIEQFAMENGPFIHDTWWFTHSNWWFSLWKLFTY